MTPNDDKQADAFDLSTDQGFDRFALAYRRRLFAFLLSKGVYTSDADDLCQEAFFTLWKNRSKPRNPQAFLMGIANRLAMAYHRKRLRLQTVSMDEAPTEAHAVPAAEAGPTRAPPAVPALPPALVALLDILTPRQRQVIDLFWLQGFSRRDAARQLGITEGALRFHEKRALDRLRTYKSPGCAGSP